MFLYTSAEEGVACLTALGDDPRDGYAAAVYDAAVARRDDGGPAEGPAP